MLSRDMVVWLKKTNTHTLWVYWQVKESHNFDTYVALWFVIRMIENLQ